MSAIVVQHIPTCEKARASIKRSKIALSSVQFHKINHVSSISKSPPLSVLLLIGEKDMNKKLTSWLFSSFLLAAPLSLQAQYHSQVWNPDNGNGTYTNPVIYADYSDPDVVAVGDDYYLTASSFNCIPGLPILHSKDLVNWEIIGYALQEQEPKELFDKPQHGKGVWAPAIRYHNGEFYIYWGDPDHGIFMVKTKDPCGTWEKPVCVWIMCPAGGVQMGWQLAMRSKNVYGPYEAKRVMAQGKTKINGPHQGAWVHTSQGEDWFLHFNDKYAYGRVIFLQPVNWKTGWPVMGQDKDGDGCGEPYLTYRMPKSTSHTKVNPQESDEFNSTELGLQWQWHANYNQLWGMPTNNGCMRLYTADLTATDKAGNPQPFKSLWEAGNLLLQKTPAENFKATTKIRFASKEDDQYGGIIMMGMNYQALVVRRMGDKFLLQQLYCKGADTGGIETEKTLATLKPTEMDTIPYSPAIYLDIYLQMKVKAGKCQFAYSLDGKRYKDAGDLFTLRQGKWIGAKMGFVSERKNTLGNRGWIDADWFRVTK